MNLPSPFFKYSKLVAIDVCLESEIYIAMYEGVWCFWISVFQPGGVTDPLIGVLAFVK